MLYFAKRRRILKNLNTLKSAVLGENFKNFLTTINFAEKKVSLMFELPKKDEIFFDNFEREVRNIAEISGFKEKDISVILTNSLEKKPESPPFETKAKEEVLPLKSVKNIICVASCKGGVGKSTIAINLAKDYAEKGFKVGLLDADIYGPSIPIMLDISNEKLEMQDGKIIPTIKDDIKIVSMGFFVKNEDALMWRGAMITKMIHSFFDGVNWGELDLLVVDLPPGTGDVYISLLTSYQVSGVLMVSSPHQVSIEELKKTTNLFKKFNIPMLGVVENMIETEGESSVFDFKVKRETFKKHGFVRTNLNFAEKFAEKINLK
jgi:ATP-binding protein involved in chromosome partitioning